jgi:hypothetical protein
MVESSALESADLLLELGQIVLDDLPDDFKIQTKVVVNNSVSQSGNLRPTKFVCERA